LQKRNRESEVLGAERHATAHVTTLGSMLRATSQKAGHAAPH
jgi:hypothetical protein